jgi:lysophospholipase L1-like esterase
VPRRIFSAGTVTNTTGAPLRLTFYANSATDRRETDLWTVDGSNNPSAQIPNGVILTDASGAYGAFAGPDDVDTLYLNAHTGSSRTIIAATGYVASSALSGPLRSAPRFAVGIARAERAVALGSVMASPPTVTVGGSNFSGTSYVEANTPTVFSGRISKFSAYNLSKVVPANTSASTPEPSFLMLGATPHTTTLAFQPVVAPNYQTGMSVTYSTYKVVFRHQGQRFALGFCGAGTGQFRIKVNGQYTSLTPYTATSGITFAQVDFGSRTVTDGATTNNSATLTSATGFTAADIGNTVTGTGIPNGATIIGWTNATTVTMSTNATATATGVSVTIGNVASRLIEFEVAGGTQGIGYIGYDRDDTIIAPDVVPGPRILGIGDSYGVGSGATYPGLTGLFQVMAADLGCVDLWLDVAGSTGYVANNGGSGQNYLTRQRVNWPIQAAAGGADLVVVFGSVNDPDPGTQADVQANAKALFQMYGNTPVVAAIASNAVPPNAAYAATLASIRAAGAQCSNFLGALDLTNDLTGSGRLGTINADGNGDRFRYSDGSHPAQAGHEHYGHRIAAYVANVLGLGIA